MSRFSPGDFLVFQLEAGFALLRLLDIEGEGPQTLWHVAGYDDLFPSVEAAEQAVQSGRPLKVSEPHIALTTRAFESTQTAAIANRRLEDNALDAYKRWRSDPNRKIADRSIRLMLGLR